ncbi:crotonase/enoyl-CoA hydratase family protein [Xylella fastidiosa]|uniref:Regulator of pathogenicity factors n=1 Tax=Xylella fastidiosa (strain 9a5c) TaxID=160492 RepID=Q9PEB3_XYLFA|nr:crotonase/enoyl-CoA hydratase family protein [Xylella fastidiosa]AAF83925.1 regulator of pathogenicity factors [Xylella fastidiosa 9a5c]ALQ94572.1 enoyl-CoA hydratase [Xylella fastidiosa]ALQ97500.1 crotonase/enoyl-CoA hydratase family protein [Xylella fastidiosa]ALR01867.1 enoyl-CoA hydratase [Xylella fastidiosa]ALR04713.1 crotonase/enoyl-CoA hydratase family protein [Xylella fastidiosa]
MSAVHPIPHPICESSIRIIEETHRDVYWIYMHTHLAKTMGGAYFSLKLIDDIMNYQSALRQRLNKQAPPLPFIVLASDNKVFNLGGDLQLFCDLIRCKDREALLDYACRCVRGAYAFHTGLNANVHSIALVQGNALGGGFEAALCCHTIVAEEGVMMGFPEVLFDLFPGMGAYSFMRQRISPKLAERLMLEGNLYSSEELLAIGLIDKVVPRGKGIEAVEQIIRDSRRTQYTWAAMQQVKRIADEVSLDEMIRITELWVDSALQLGSKSLRTMERLIRAQQTHKNTALKN